MLRCRPLLLLLLGFSWCLEAFAQPAPEGVRPSIVLRQVMQVAPSTVRLARDPSNGLLYALSLGGSLYQLALTDTPSLTEVARHADHGLSLTLGLAFADDGTLYLVGNESNDSTNTGRIRRGVRSQAGAEARTWTTVATTIPYPRSNTAYDHNFNAVAVSPEGAFLLINSGSRTDHGEVQDNSGRYPGLREVPLTSAIFRIPADGQDLVLPDDLDALRQQGYLFADGTRNSFDLAFAPNGDLFGTENSGDRDDSEELNWLREGHHYGFPWRMGGNDTPQQVAGYDPDADALVNPSSYAYQNGFFYDDPAFPPPPAGLDFTEPVASLGPDADRFRDPADGLVKDASDLGRLMYTFTSHRSPLGLIFDADSTLNGDLRGGAFVLAWTGTESDLLRPLGDSGEDLLHLDLDKQADRYEARVTRLVQGFENPIDAVMIDEKIYVVEYGGTGARRGLWEVDLQATDTAVGQGEQPEGAVLLPNYPNPFNPATTLRYHLARPVWVHLAVYDVLGREVAVLVDAPRPAGTYTARFDAAGLQGGVYLARLNTGALSQAQTMLLIK